MFFRLIFIFISTIFFNSVYADESTCNNFISTVWEGEKKGKGYQGPITINFKDECKKSMFGNGYQVKYDWVGKNGKIVTPGALTFKDNGDISYQNTAGSKGRVEFSENNLTFKNVFTGNNYKVEVSIK